MDESALRSVPLCQSLSGEERRIVARHEIDVPAAIGNRITAVVEERCSAMLG